MNTIPKKKKLSLNAERNKALQEFQRLRVEEEMFSGHLNRCCTCGEVVDNAQGGHWISRVCRATELEEDNVHAQCPICNAFGKGGGAGEPIAYRDYLLQTIGAERVQRLEDMARAYRGDDEAFERLSPHDRSIARGRKSAVYYKEKADEFRRRRKVLRERKGL